MADHLTEEEQLDALKRWWKENWLSLVVPILVLLVGYFGWNMRQNHLAGQAQLASEKFSALTAAAETPPGQAMTAEQKQTVGELAEGLASDYEGSLYADMANMVMARIFVDDDQLEAAATRLQTVVDSGASDSVKELAKARLARVLASSGDQEKALNLLAQSPSEAYKSLYAEVKGDIYLAQGKTEAANTAYSEAIESLPASEFNRSSLLQLKRDAVAMPEVKTKTSEDQSAVEGDA